jgi:WD40 repeat protein
VLLTLPGHPPTPTGVAFSPDGTRLATAGLDSTAKVWDFSAALTPSTGSGQGTGAGTAKELFTLSGHKGYVYAVTYSADGKRIATAGGDGTAKVWDAATGQELLTLTGHTGALYDVAFSPDGKLLGTASSDGTAKVWNVSSGSGRSEQPLTLYNPNAQLIDGIVFSPDGKRLAVAGGDGTARIYALPLEDLIAIAKSRVTRALTTDECKKYLHVDKCP